MLVVTSSPFLFLLLLPPFMSLSVAFVSSACQARLQRLSGFSAAPIGASTASCAFLRAAMPNPPQVAQQYGGSGGPESGYGSASDSWSRASHSCQYQYNSNQPPQSTRGRPSGSRPPVGAGGSTSGMPSSAAQGQSQTHAVPAALRDALSEIRAAQEELQAQSSHIDRAEKHIGQIRTNVARLASRLADASLYLVGCFAGLWQWCVAAGP